MATSSTASAAPVPSSAEEYVEAIRSLLANGEAGAARRAAAEGAARYPKDLWLKKTHRIINPHKVASEPADAPDRTQEFAWLREHAARYRGRWVALLKDELLASAPSLEAVLNKIRERGLESRALVHRIA